MTTQRTYIAALLASALALPTVPVEAAVEGPRDMLTSASNAVLPTARNNLGAAAKLTATGGVSARPSPLGNWDSATTGCTGNLSGTVLASCFSITGAATLSQPTTGYAYTPEAYPFPSILYNSSGWNESLSSNVGRTAAASYRVNVQQYGQGDLVAFNCSGFINSTRSGSTSFLANPAVSCFNGGMSTNVAGGYLNFGEMELNDAGFDAAGIGWVIRLNRTLATGAKNVNWGGETVQSTGTKSADWAYRAAGPYRVAIDLTGTTHPGLTLIGITVTNGGAGYTVGDTLIPSDGTGDQVTTLKVLTVSGGVITSVGIDRAGLYTAVPSLGKH